MPRQKPLFLHNTKSRTRAHTHTRSHTQNTQRYIRKRRISLLAVEILIEQYLPFAFCFLLTPATISMFFAIYECCCGSHRTNPIWACFVAISRSLRFFSRLSGCVDQYHILLCRMHLLCLAKTDQNERKHENSQWMNAHTRKTIQQPMVNGIVHDGICWIVSKEHRRSKYGGREESWWKTRIPKERWLVPATNFSSTLFVYCEVIHFSWWWERRGEIESEREGERWETETKSEKNCSVWAHQDSCFVFSKRVYVKCWENRCFHHSSNNFHENLRLIYRRTFYCLYAPFHRFLPLVFVVVVVVVVLVVVVVVVVGAAAASIEFVVPLKLFKSLADTMH